MKKIIILLFIVFSILATKSVYSANLQIEISKIKYISGKIFVLLNNDSDIFPSFKKVSRSYKWLKLNVDKKKIRCSFKNIPPGLYAVSIFHDVNNNKIFDTNAIGIPEEPYGFSNNPFSFFGALTFKSASFNLADKDLRHIKIKLKE